MLIIPSLSFARDLDIDIKGTSIERLMQVNVTTVSRWEEDLQSSAAAVYVLTRETIHRSHVTSVPEALRLVPGVQVAKVDANKWAVSIRGFNSRASNKLLVLIDGRSVYDPLFTGVLWEARDVTLDEIERIEVVRGPGGTLWGTNAVNGVINIITRHARDTQGVKMSVGAGTEERANAGIRYGWQPGNNIHARVYADGFERDTGFSTAGSHDDSQMARAGFRADWDVSADDRVMFKVDAFDGKFGTGMGDNFQDLEHQGQSFIARWDRDRTDGSQTTLQFWYDRFSFNNVSPDFGEDRDTYDIEAQHAFRAGDVHHIVFGAGYRSTSDDISIDLPPVSIEPESRQDDLYNLFLQDEISLAEHIRLILGVKVERNDYSGTEWQPNARIAWTPNKDSSVWGAISRAVRSPSRLESDIKAQPLLSGNPDFDSEKLLAYEAGYRSRLTENVWMDAAVFYNVYRKLFSIENRVVDNKLRGTTAGVEIAASWQASSAMSCDIAYTYLNMDIKTEADGTDEARAALTEDSDPRHQVVLRGTWTPFNKIEVDALFRYVDELRALDVPSYLTADLGVDWRPRKGLVVSAVAQNLLDSHHPEQSDVPATVPRASSNEVQRGYYLKASWEF
jgi:iron complex outermembrane receptor protein